MKSSWACTGKKKYIQSSSSNSIATWSVCVQVYVHVFVLSYQVSIRCTPVLYIQGSLYLLNNLAVFEMTHPTTFPLSEEKELILIYWISCLGNWYNGDCKHFSFFIFRYICINVVGGKTLSEQNTKELWSCTFTNTVEPPIVDPPAKGHSIINLLTKDTGQGPKNLFPYGSNTF